MGVLLVLMAGLFILDFYIHNSPTSNTITEENTNEQITPVAELPIRLLIPSIDVDANIQHVGTSTKYKYY